MIGRVVWDMVQSKESNGRSLFLLASMDPNHLFGISRTFPKDLTDKCRLAISPEIDPGILKSLPSDHHTDRPPVYFRNTDEAEIILIAVTDEVLDSVGTSLGPVTRIDRSTIQAETEIWLDQILNTLQAGTISDEKKEWLRSMLRGLDQSKVAKTLDQFVHFVAAFISKPNEGKLFDERLRTLGPILKLPKNCFATIPSSKKRDNKRTENFIKMFRTAEQKISGIPYLTGSDEKRLDAEAIRHRLKTIPSEDKEKVRTSYAVEALLDKQVILRQGKWHDVQDNFCKEFDWGSYGEQIFGVRNIRAPRTLSGKTRQFFEKENPSHLKEVEPFLDSLEQRKTSAEEEKEFFKNQQHRLIHNKRLYEDWRRHLFADEITDEPDLLTAVLLGVQSLLIKNIDGESGRLPEGAKIILTAKGYDKESTWTDLDKRTYALFLQELRLLIGALSKHIDFRFGKWPDINDCKSKSAKNARRVELEMIMEDVSGSVQKSAQIRIFWRPSGPQGDSISLAWNDDIKSLYEGIKNGKLRLPKETFTSKGFNTDNSLPISLFNTGSFSDVCGEQAGRTTDAAKCTDQNDQFARIVQSLEQYIESNVISVSTGEAVINALLNFRKTFTDTISQLYRKPEKIYRSDQIFQLAEAFGLLCSVTRNQLAEFIETRLDVMKEICELGIIKTSTSHKISIIPAWHPLRLLERQAKALAVGELVNRFLCDRAITGEGIQRACTEYQNILSTWCFPEIINVNHETYYAVEHCGGYSLAVPGEISADSPQEIDANVDKASEVFIKVAEEYLSLYPHEENNFSVAIYNSESPRLPTLIADEIDKKMRRLPHLRCSILITHDDPRRMRQAFVTQNTRMQMQNLNGTAEGFLSRLRVSVYRDTANRSDKNNTMNSRPEIDMVLLHDVFYRHSKMYWDFIPGESDGLSNGSIDLRNNILTRHHLLSSTSSKTIKTALSPIRVPKSVAQYMDLCFITDKETRIMKTGFRAVPMRRISWAGDNEIQNTIERAHDLAEWVVSFDQLSCRPMLADHRIKVIRNMDVPGAEARLMVSSREFSKTLLQHIQTHFERAEILFLRENSHRIAESIVGKVAESCGQKIMLTTRSANAAREIIGLAVATTLVETLHFDVDQKLLWFSLDDNRSLFDLKNEVADLVAVSIHAKTPGKYSITLTVVEAKCVSRASSSQETKKSCAQTRSTLSQFWRKLITQTDPMVSKVWGARLFKLLTSHAEFSQQFTLGNEFECFKDVLVSGQVDFECQGWSVVLKHDDTRMEGIEKRLGFKNDDAIYCYTLGQKAIKLLVERLECSNSRTGPGFHNIGKIGEEHGVPTPESIRKIVQDVGGPVISRKGDEPVMSPMQYSEGVAPDQTPNQQQNTQHEDHFSGPDVIENVETLSDFPPSSEEKCLIRENIIDSTVDSVEPPNHEEQSPKHLGIAPLFRQALMRIASHHGQGTEREREGKFATAIARRLQSALNDFDMNAVLADHPTTPTPNGVIVRFKGHSTLTIKKIESRKSELRTTHSLGVVDIRAGLGEISIFVARQKRRLVDLASVWLEAEWPNSSPDKMYSFLIGIREDNGKKLWVNLDSDHGGYAKHAPHTLIAGETGSGKGVLTQNLLLQMVAFNDPRNLRLYLIDPKFGVDFFWISDAPHLERGIISDRNEAEMLLEGVVVEMERRFQLIREAKVPNIQEYNAKVGADKSLPRIIVIHDEMADWMAGYEEYRVMILNTVTRLAAKSRACGINIIMITQRAAQDAIPVGIRDNLGNRLCLKVASKAGSELALGMAGAERLLDKGHLAARIGGDKPSDSEYFTVQVPFAGTKELEDLGRSAIAVWK